MDNMVDSLHEPGDGEEVLMAREPHPLHSTTKEITRKRAASWTHQESDETVPNQLPTTDQHEWIIDTGATAHMTSNKDMFTHFRPLTTNRKVQTGGARLPICGIGTVRIATLHGTPFVSRTADQRGRFWCLSDFTRRTDETALIAGLDNRTQGTIGDAALVGEAESDMEETSEYNLWHRRLGHFGEDKCDVCLEAKMRRENFGPSAPKTELLELVSVMTSELGTAIY
ncbi:hypothetical protein VTN31DRAFT_2345 [Thermomyces dupontii]|uniref:uncharacterized protein n=1 Tax=Talaromyces thermophilus TaxID=28565 RepID=UPI0037443539